MTIYVVIFVGIWLVFLLAWWLTSRAFRSAETGRITGRLMGTTKSQKKRSQANPALLRTEDGSTGKLVLRLLRRYRYQEWAQTLLEQAGLKWKAARLAHACLGFFLGGFFFVWYGLPVYRAAAPVAALACAVLPLLYVRRVRSKRLRKFEEQFPESLEFVARSMRAGHAFSVSLEMLHREFQEPLAGEFRRTFEEHNLGLPLETALMKLAQRVPSMDVHFFVSAVLLQRRTGGNLAEILDKLATLIRERFKLRGKIRAISAHGRMTGTALTCIPLAVALMMFYINPDYVRFFFEDSTGQVMALIGVVLQLVGYAIIKRIVRIEV